MKLKILLLIALTVLGCTEQTMEEQPMIMEIRSQLGNVLLSGNPIWVDVSAALPEGATQYEILLRIVSNDGALIGSPMIDAVAPDNTGMSSFNIQARVDQPVDYDFEFPQVNKFNAYNLLAFDITIEPGQRYIDSSGNRQTEWSGIYEDHRILKGGLSHWKQNEVQPYLFFDNFIQPGNFLTWQYNGSKISPYQPLKLWYIYSGLSIAPDIIKYNVVYKNGEIEGKTESIEISTENLYEINLSPELWAVETTKAFPALGGEESDVSYIEVYLEKDGVAKSEKRKFYFDLEYYEENTFIYFKHSIGGIDCMWCNGRVVEYIDPEKTVATRPDLPTANLKRGTQVVSSVTSQRTWEINTGYKQKEEIEALRDFVLSDQMWLVRGNYVIPVILEDKKQVMAQISRNLDDIQFSIIEAHKENRY